MTFEKILVCLDGSKLAEQILPYATEVALRFDSKVVLLQVVTLPTAFVIPAVPGAPAIPVQTPTLLEVVQKEEIEAKEYLEQVAQPLRKRGLQVECVTLQGSAGQTIINYSIENKIGLIAISTHGRSGLRRLVFGSVADFVLRESGMPILVIKPQGVEA